MKMRTEGKASKQDGYWKSHTTIICWEKRLAKAKGLLLHLQAEILQLKEMKCILAWARTFPCESQGWTINFLEQLLPESQRV